MSDSSGTPGWWVRLSQPDNGQPAPGRKPLSEQTIQLTMMVYFWWIIPGGVAEILFGGIYLGSKHQAVIGLSTPVLQLCYVLLGIVMIELGLGVLRLEAWVYWAAWLFSLALAAVSAYEVFRWVTGVPIAVETGTFAILNVLFVLYNIYFLLQPGVRATLRFAPFQSGHFSPPLAMFGVVLGVPALAVTLLVQHVDTHLSTPVLALVYVLGGAILIVMAYGALRLQAWVWWAAWLFTAALTAMSVDLIVRPLTGGSVSVEALIFSAANILVVANVVYYLVRADLRKAFVHDHARVGLFSPPTLIGGLALALFALIIYLLPGELGQQAVAYTVLGLAVGAVVGLLPYADPVARLMGFMVGELLAFASFLIRGGLLPYTNLSAAVVVLLLLLVITGITALFRSSAWFISMLLGAGTLYGVLELQFRTVPSAYLATASLAFVAILLSFGIGYMVSALLGLRPVAPSPADATPSYAASATRAAATPSGATAAGPASEGGTGKHAGGSQQGPRETGTDDTQDSEGDQG